MNKPRMRFLPGALCALAFAVPPVAMGADTGAAAARPVAAKASLSAADREFVKAAARGNETEIKFGQVAVNKAESSQVRELAQRIVDDHTQANAKLKDIAQKDGFDIPTSPDAKEMQEIERLQKLSGKDFDRNFVKILVKDHEQDIAAFKKQAKEGSNADVKQFAENTLPKLQEHLAKARSAAKSVGAS